MDLALIAVGALLLYLGGDLLVKNASRLAALWGLSPLVVGLTVVAFGTSAPEMAASVTAALRGNAEIAVGNVIGSNTANVALILGLTALIYPISTSARFLRREMPIMLLSAGLLMLLLLDGQLGRLEGAGLVILLLFYLLALFRVKEAPEVAGQFGRAYGVEPVAPWRASLGVLLGLGLLVLGAQSLVTGASALARAMGVPELIIGLTIVAVGTSLPELATSLLAAIRHEPDIALGNIVGSNIFNVLGILGVTALVRPTELPFHLVAADLAIMLGVSALLLPLLYTGWRLGRLEGGGLLVLYLAYLGFLAWR